MNPNLNTTPNNDGQPSSDPVTPTNDNLQPVPPTPVTPVTPVAPQAHMPVATGDETDQKSRLAMMAFAFFAAPTGVARAYIGDKSGVVRFWIYIVCIVLSLIPLINILTGLVILVLSIWGIVDYFMLKGRLVDAQGQQLHTTNRDDRFVKYLNIFFYVGLILSALAIVAIIIAISVIGVSGFTNRLDATNQLNGQLEPFNGSSRSLDGGTFEYSTEFSL